MKFVFWQPMLCIHQSAHARALAELGHQVVVAAEQDLSPARRRLGWGLPDLSGVEVLVAPHQDQVQALAVDSMQDSLHLIVGTRGWKLGRQAYLAASQRGARIALLQESGDPRGLRGLARRAAYSLQHAQMAKHVEFVLAMGEMGTHWYQQCGWPIESVFPYAYFMERAETVCPSVLGQNSDPVQIVYAGQFIRRKGLDLLLHSLSALTALDWRLSLVGSGPEEAALRAMADGLGLSDRIRFCGSLAHQEALGLVASSDLLVLPSRFDGWGAVVSEALMMGVPAVCSDRCGASVLLADSARGRVFRSESENELAAALRHQIEKGKVEPEGRTAVIKWTRQIEGPSAARYLLQVLDHLGGLIPRPLPPWT
jgi:glycosyltransferase involved in cell wall biosynthesis